MPVWLQKLNPMALTGGVGAIVLGALDHAKQGWPANWSNSDWILLSFGLFILTGSALASGASNLVTNVVSSLGTSAPPPRPPLGPMP